MTSEMYNWRWRLLVQYFSGLAWRAYDKPRLVSTRSLIAKDYVEIAANQEYIDTVSDIRYG